MVHTRDFIRNGQGCKLIENAKHNYFMKIGKTLSNADTGQKPYWTKIPVIPPLLENYIFVLDYKTKAQILNDYLILQCTTK